MVELPLSVFFCATFLLIFMIVSVKPKFSDRLQNVYYASANDNVTLQCEINLPRHPPISWHFNNQPLKGNQSV